MYFIVKNLRRQIEIPPDKFGRMINVLMPTVPPVPSNFARYDLLLTLLAPHLSFRFAECFSHRAAESC